ncbi:hypothetical protein F2P81_020245 [Scophthalmus maximus]|uniref:Uncharacterized protein n=1 Tax=Scophthalmus maximus TaxID=52904 RepID=A0A6A4S9Y1_SCOMX|nr:hypothetical protein F2P81_020245 [Scophthalmus maximus]
MEASASLLEARPVLRRHGAGRGLIHHFLKTCSNLVVDLRGRTVLLRPDLHMTASRLQPAARLKQPSELRSLGHVQHSSLLLTTDY